MVAGRPQRPLLLNVRPVLASNLQGGNFPQRAPSIAPGFRPPVPGWQGGPEPPGAGEGAAPASGATTLQPLGQAPAALSLVAPRNAQQLSASDKAQLKVQKLQAHMQERSSAEAGEGYFQPPRGYVIEEGGSNYTVTNEKPLGVGTFSAVYEVANHENKLLALKVIRSQPFFRNKAMKEVKTMLRVAENASNDEEGSSNVLLLLDHFMHGDHLCMAYHKLGVSLRQLGKQPLDKVVPFSNQLLLGLRYLHESTGLVHCDVKPDNLLLRHDGLAIRLCDFGAAAFSPDIQAVDELQPLFYRAPEVLVGAPRGRKIDMWSAGCTIFEMAVGRILFRDCNSTRDCVEKIMRLRGVIPESMRKSARHAAVYFVEQGFQPEAGGVQRLENFKAKPMYPELAGFVDFGTSKGLTAQELAKAQLSRLIGGTATVSAAQQRSSKAPAEGEQKLQSLAELIESLMAVDPTSRMSAADAVKLKIFKDVKPPPSTGLETAPPLPQAPAPPLPDVGG